MKIIENKLIPFKGFCAINLFGYLFCRDKSQINDVIVNHEEIHTAQMKELLYLPFYILYLIFWIIRVVTPPFETSYRDISLEQEAYDNERNLDYMNARKHYSWVRYMFRSSNKE